MRKSHTLTTSQTLQHGTADLWSSVGLVVLFGAMFFLFKLPPTFDHPPPEASVIADLSDKIVVVDEHADGGATLEIVLDHPPTYMANILTDLGRNAVVISRGLQRHFPGLLFEKVRFVAQRNAQGIEGVMLSERVVAIEFDSVRLMRLDLEPNFPFQKLLNMSSRLILGGLQDEVVVRAFCADKVSEKAAAFCLRELK